MYLPTPLGDCWGVDTSAKLSAGLLAQLANVDLHDFWPGAPAHEPIGFYGRYVNLPGVSPAKDIDRVEAQFIAATGKPLVLFQHVRFDSWIASASQGSKDAGQAITTAAAAGYAPVIGYPAPSLVKDCEAVGNPGPACVLCTQAFHDVILGGAYGPGAYKGFDSGLTDAQFAALNCPIACDAGHRSAPPGRGFCYVQMVQVTMFGVQFDVVHATLDELGQGLVGMAEISVDVAPDSGAPHFDPSGPVAVARGSIPIPTSAHAKSVPPTRR